MAVAVGCGRIEIVLSDGEAAFAGNVGENSPSKAEEAPTFVDAEMPTPTPTPEPTDAVTEITPTPVPVVFSSTTGNLIEESTRYQPILCVIGNSPKMRPQMGLMQADIIYEFPLEKDTADTCLVALFSDARPPEVGPILDARCYMADVFSEWGGAFVYKGYPDVKEYPANSAEFSAVNGSYCEENDTFFTENRIVSSDEASTTFFRLAEFANTVYGSYQPEQTEQLSFEYGVFYEFGRHFDRVSLPFNSSDPQKAEFVYNLDDNMLYRYERNSKGALVQSKTLSAKGDGGSSYASEPLRVQNLIVQHVRYDALFDRYRSVGVIGSGECDYFVNGQYVAGNWSRKSADEPTTYTLRDGTPLVLEPGTTWIALQPSSKDIRIRYGG